MRRLCMFGVVAVAALTGSGAPQAQTPVTNQRVWTGTWEEHDSWEGSNRFGRSQAQISFVYVEGRDESGTPRWESRRLTWSALWEESIFDHLALELVGVPDERGFTQNRYQTDIVTYCAGGGTLELGPAVPGSGDELTPEQKEQLRSDCVTTSQPRDSSVPTPPPTLSKRDALPAPSMPNEEQLTGCAYEKMWLMGNRGAGSFSVSVSAPVTAVMEVDPKEFGRFVPVPGETLTFTASVPAGTARFRFELDPDATSHFPGYATNADVDDAFFARYKLARLRGLYANDGPDVIFSPKYFGAQEWSRVEPLVVETAKPQSAAVVTVTTMDYGAVGKLRAFVKSEECGDWQPVPVRFGRETRDSVAIPLDDDNNLMADALPEYRGRDSGADDDAEPKGNGTAGDGLTAFEEYRGFMTRGADFCEELRSDVHLRTTTGRKDLFIATDVPQFAAFFPFAGSQVFDLDIHALCGRHIVDGDALLDLDQTQYNPAPRGELTGTRDARILNFTLQRPRVPHVWRGEVVSQDYPQRALVVTVFLRGGLFGLDGYPLALAIPVEPDLMGPPGATTLIIISDDDLDREDPRSYFSQLTHRLLHEVGHAVGMPHHGDTVQNWRARLGRKNITADLSPRQRSGQPPDFTATVENPEIQVLVVDPGPECRETDDNAAFQSGKFVGCLTPRIVRRGEENSGNFKCPMRYPFGEHSYYEPSGVAATFRWTGTVTGIPPDYQGTPSYTGGSRHRNPLTLKADAWEGRLLRYRADRETVPLGRFCDRITGTRINAGSGDSNHSGDAGRTKPCRDFLVVNDTVLRGVR